MPDKIKHFYEFDEFRLDAENRSLWRGGELVQIFSKALEILVLLVEKKGAVVSPEELLETIWGDCFGRGALPKSQNRNRQSVGTCPESRRRLQLAWADALQKCLELREERVIRTKDEPRFDKLRGEARFQEILSQIKLN